MTEPLLPPGVRVSAAIGENEEMMVHSDFTAQLPNGGGTITGSVIATPRAARAWAALLLKQADLIEGRERGGVASGLRLVGEGK